jgi:hypothetical protein
MTDDRIFKAVELLAAATVNEPKSYKRRGYRITMLDLLEPRGSTKVPSLQLRSLVAYLKVNMGEDDPDYILMKQVQDVLEGKDGSNT